MSLAIILLGVLFLWIVVKHYYYSFRFPPGVNFINILRMNFLYECRFGSFLYITMYIEKKLQKHCLYEKFVCKMLMKLTTGLPRLPVVGTVPFLRGETGSRVLLSSVNLIPKYGDIIGYFMGPNIK